MSIAFTKNGKKYELALDGTVKADGTAHGTWTTDEDNALEITAKKDGAVLRQPARWSTKTNRLSVQPEGGEAVEFIDATGGDIQFRVKNNRLQVDPVADDEFSFALSGDWGMTADFSAIQLKTAADTLTFTGGLNDSQSRFVWAFDAETAAIKKRFNLRFDGAWKLQKRADNKAGVLAVFSFEYTVKGATTKDTFELPVELTADTAHGNRLLLSYKRDGSATQWGVAFAGRFTTKGGAVIGYSAELYDENGKISSRFTFDFKGKIKDKSTGTRNTLKFELTVAGQAIDLTLAGSFNFTKSSLTFSLKLNTSTKTGEISTISFGVKFATTDGLTVDLNVLVDGKAVTIVLKVNADIKLGGSRKGSVYGFLDMKLNGETVGIDAMIGITLN